MPIEDTGKGLKGLRGLNDLSREEYTTWYNKNAKLLSRYKPTQYDRIYKNQQYVELFGEDTFNLYKAADRDKMYEDFVKKDNSRQKYAPTETKFSIEGGIKLFDPANVKIEDLAKGDHSGFKSTSSRLSIKPTTKINYQMDPTAFDFLMSHDSKYIDELEESGYVPTEQLKKQLRQEEDFREANLNKALNSPFIPSSAKGAMAIANPTNEGFARAIAQKRLEKNEELLNRVIQHARDDEYAEKYQSVEDEIYNNKYATLLPSQAEQLYKKALEEDKKLGVSYFSAFYGDGGDDVEDELKNYTPDEMKHFLAKREVLQNHTDWGGDAVGKYMNYEQQQYIHDNQSDATRFWLDAKDIAINTLAYTANKWVVPVGGVLSRGIDALNWGDNVLGLDLINDKTFIDNATGEYLSRDDVSKVVDKKGNLLYYRNNKTGNRASLQEASATDMFWAGKYFNGEEIGDRNLLLALANPRYLNDISTYNTMSEDEIQKAKDNLGISVYRPVYNVGETESMGMSVARMSSFVISDVIEQIALGLMTGGSGNAAVATARASSGFLSNMGRYLATAAVKTAPFRGAIGISNQYGVDAREEALQNNLQKNEEANRYLAKQQTENWIQNNPEAYDSLIEQEYQKLKAEDNRRLKQGSGDSNTQLFARDDASLREQAEFNVLSSLEGNNYLNIINSDENGARMQQAKEDASVAGFISMASEAMKYSALNFGFRRFLYNSPAALAQKAAEKSLKGVITEVKDGVVRYTKKAIHDPWKAVRIAGSQFGNGFATNYTDELQTGFAVGWSNTLYNNYLLNQANGEAYNQYNNTQQWVAGNILQGALEGMGYRWAQDSTLHAGWAGGLGFLLINPIKAPFNVAEVMRNRNKLSKLLKEGKTQEAEDFRRTHNYRYWTMDKDAKGIIDNTKAFFKGTSEKGFIENLSDYLSNGVLNEYAAEMQGNRAVNHYIDFVEKLMDKNTYDYSDVAKIIALDKLPITGTLDAKDQETLKAYFTLNALKKAINYYSNSNQEGDQAVRTLLEMHPDYQQVMSLVDEYESSGNLNDETKEKLLKEYYVQNPQVAKTDDNDAKALGIITNNLHELKKMSDLQDKYRAIIEDKESARGKKFDENLKENLIYLYSIKDVIQNRSSSMEREVSGNDFNIDEIATDDLFYLLSYGDLYNSRDVHREALKTSLQQLSDTKDDYYKRQSEVRNKIQELTTYRDNNLLEEEERKSVESQLEQLRLEDKTITNNLAHTEATEARLKYRYDSLNAAYAHFENSEDGEVTIRTVPVKEAQTENPKALRNISKLFSGRKLDLNNEKHLQEAWDKIKKLPYATRARLVENIRNEIAEREKPDGEKKHLLFSDKNFKILKSIYDYALREDAESIEKIRDIQVLNERERLINEEISESIDDPEVALYRMNGAMEAELEHASALYYKKAADSFKEDAYKDLQKLFPRGLKANATKENRKAAYNFLFIIFRDFHPKTIDYMNSHLDEFKHSRNIIKEVKLFNDKMQEVLESAKAINPELTDENLQDMYREIINNINAETFTANDIIYGINQLRNREGDSQSLYQGIYDRLVKLDRQRNSTFVETAETQTKRTAEKLARKARREAKEAEAKRIEEEKERKKRETAAKREAETKARQEEIVKQVEEIKNQGKDEVDNRGIPKNAKDAIVRVERTSLGGTTSEIVYSISDKEGITTIDVKPSSLQDAVKLEDFGLTPEDVLGKKEHWGTPENYDEAVEYLKDGFKPSKITIGENNTIEIEAAQSTVPLIAQSNEAHDKLINLIKAIVPEVFNANTYKEKEIDTTQPIALSDEVDLGFTFEEEAPTEPAQSAKGNTDVDKTISNFGLKSEVKDSYTFPSKVVTRGRKAVGNNYVTEVKDGTVTVSLDSHKTMARRFDINKLGITPEEIAGDKSKYSSEKEYNDIIKDIANNKMTLKEAVFNSDGSIEITTSPNIGIPITGNAALTIAKATLPELFSAETKAASTEASSQSEKNQKEQDRGLLNVLGQGTISFAASEKYPNGSGDVDSGTKKLILAKAKRVLENPNSSIQQMHDAISFTLNNGERIAAPAPVLTHIYNLQEAVKRGNITVEEALTNIEKHILKPLDTATRKVPVKGIQSNYEISVESAPKTLDSLQDNDAIVIMGYDNPNTGVQGTFVSKYEDGYILDIRGSKTFVKSSKELGSSERDAVIYKVADKNSEEPATKAVSAETKLGAGTSSQEENPVLFKPTKEDYIIPEFHNDAGSHIQGFIGSQEEWNKYVDYFSKYDVRKDASLYKVEEDLKVGLDKASRLIEYFREKQKNYSPREDSTKTIKDAPKEVYDTLYEASDYNFSAEASYSTLTKEELAELSKLGQDENYAMPYDIAMSIYKKVDDINKAEGWGKYDTTPSGESLTGVGGEIDLGINWSKTEDNPVPTQTLEQQIDEAQVNATEESNEVEVVHQKEEAKKTQPKDSNLTNAPSTLLGHVMSQIDYAELRDNHHLRKKALTQVGVTTAKQYRAWMESEGINLENIIDNELGLILKNNPNVRVMPMRVIATKGSNDTNVGSVVFSVIEYDSNVAKVHNKDNGGVIKSNGKEYLIIGTMGFIPNSTQKLDFQRMRDDFFTSTKNSKERFVVSDKYHTTIDKINAGFIVTQLESDNATSVRSVTDLLSSKERNPHGLTIKDLKWYIVKSDEEASAKINMKRANYYTPSEPERNMGGVFMFVEGANGYWVPAKMETSTIQDLKEGSKLKETIDNLLTKVTSRNFEERKEAVIALDKLLYFSSEYSARPNVLNTTGRMLWIGNEKLHQLTLTETDNHGNKIPIRTFNLTDTGFNVQDFIDAVYEQNVRIQITPSTLQNPNTIKEYSDAGVLRTNVARLTTARPSFSIKAMDAEGNPINPTSTTSERVNIGTNEFRTPIKTITYNGKNYRQKEGVWYNEKDAPIKGTTKNTKQVLEQLEWNDKINNSGVKPALSLQGFNFYILDSNPDNPIVVKRSNTTNHVTVADRDGALKTIKRYEDKQALENHADNASKILNLSDEVDLGPEAISIDPVTGEIFRYSEAPSTKGTAIVSKIQEDSSHFSLTEDESGYVDDRTGRKSARVTKIAEADKNGKPFKDNGWKTPSTTLGNINDTIVRDYFDTSLKEEYPNVPQSLLTSFLSQLHGTETEKSFLAKAKEVLGVKELHVIPKEVMAHGVIEAVDKNGKKHKIEVAGTLDLLLYDENNNFYVFDMKTIRSYERLTDNKFKWSQQTSMYQKFLVDGQELNIKGRYIVPTKLSYPTPRGEKAGGRIGTTEYANKDGELYANGKPFELTQMELLDIVPVDYYEPNIIWEKLPSDIQELSRQYEETLNTDKGTGIETARKESAVKRKKRTPKTKQGMTFSDVLNNVERGVDVMMTIAEKFGQDKMTMPVNELTQFLESKKIPTTGIVNIDSFIDNIKNCK